MAHKGRFRAACWCLVALLAACCLHKYPFPVCTSSALQTVFCAAVFRLQECAAIYLYRADSARTRKSGAQ